MLAEKSFYRSRIINSFILFFMVIFIGTFGYHLIEGWSLVDGLYMTVITIATVGYGETHSLSTGGRLFTVFFIIISLGTVGYSVSSLAAFIMEGEFNRLLKGRRMDKRIAKLTNHLIICGAGETGKCVADELLRNKKTFVVIEKNNEVMQSFFQHLGEEVPHIAGDATEDDVLLSAGIEKAEGLVTVLSEDKDNVFVVLSARSLNPSLRIVSRLTHEFNEEKLKKAGADEIVSPNYIGGIRIASVMIRPTVVGFLDAMMRVPDKTIRVHEYKVSKDSTLCGKTLSEAEIGKKTGLLVMAVKPFKGGYHFNPGASTGLNENDVLIVVGPVDKLELLD